MKKQGIAIIGLNGCGKSTLTHALARATGYYAMDVEDYYFPEQKKARIAALENCSMKKTDATPFSHPQTREAVEAAILKDMELHSRFILCSVKADWNAEILARVDLFFLVQLSQEDRLRRVQRREEMRFGKRVLPGGDLFAQQEAFREMVKKRDPQIVEKSVAKLLCPVILLNGALPVEENVKNMVDAMQ